mgnify:CR=1 FL=1
MADILNKLRVDVNQVKKSQTWFNHKILEMKSSHVTANSLTKDASLTKKSKITPGQLYFFYYDPKYKDTLPYYDAFPMVFPFSAVDGGFLGLNLHYLGYAERFALFKKLLDVNGKKIHEQMKMKFTWDVVSAFSSIKGIDNCVKHYLYDHIRSPLMMVSPKDWTTSMLLPVEKFVGARKEYVWNQTKRTN